MSAKPASITFDLSAAAMDQLWDIVDRLHMSPAEVIEASIGATHTVMEIFEIAGNSSIPEPVGLLCATADETAATHTCGACGSELEHIRPGRWQCNHCEAAPLDCAAGDE